jgi:D-amino-acid dehydrogenase
LKVLVLGAGVIGVTTSYYLAKAGHEVTVLDRQSGPALETSFANAGEISPGYASPWAAPGVPRKAIRWLLMKHAPLILRPELDRETLGWLVALLHNCTKARYAINKERMVRLAEFSRACLIELRAATGIRYDERTRGTLQLFRTQRQLDSVAKDIEVLKARQVPFSLLDRTQCVAVEPGLGVSAHLIAGGLHLPNDETGDCHKFTTKLAALAADLGVSFEFGTTVDRLEVENRSITAAISTRGRRSADAYVLALGSYSTPMARSIGIRLPIYPVKGYSITVPVTDDARAPQSTLMDETFKIAITRLGDRIRIGGMAEVSGFSRDLPTKRRRTLENSVQSLFPGAGDMAAGSFWTGLRPMTPDGPPIVGPTGIRNLYINSGHGTLGWTMACGSGHLLADIVCARDPAIDASDLSMSRYED